MISASTRNGAKQIAELPRCSSLLAVCVDQGRLAGLVPTHQTRGPRYSAAICVLPQEAAIEEKWRYLVESEERW